MVEGVLRLRLVVGIAPGAAWATLQPAAGTDPDHPARLGTVGHLAGLDSLRQLPDDAVRRAAPGGDGPGRTVVLALINRLGLVALVALACYG